ncbi:MAG: hypothetical protein IIY88_02825 [Eubacterium sp.]|nr:hypothetical protein [Eubacterium sp.]
MTDITKDIVLNKLVDLVVQLPEGTITSTTELMDILFNESGYTDEKGYYYNSKGLAFYVNEDEYYDLDYDFFFKAREHDVYLDDSPFIDTVVGLRYHNKFVVRKGATKPMKDLVFDISKLL